MPASVEFYQHIGEAVAIGLLIGSERYKARDAGEKRSAGIRTFALVAVLGAACALIGVVALTVATFVALVALLAAGYMRQRDDSLGLTTELAAVLTFWLGYMTRDFPVLALSTSVVVAVLLASKRALHTFVRGVVTDTEFDDTLKFLVVVLVVMPLLPSEPMGPYGFFNPAQAWGLVILVSSVSYFGYLAIRILGAQRGLMAGSLIGGLVSTTAVTMSLASRARQAATSSTTFGLAAVLANAVQLPRLLVLVAVVDLDVARVASPTLLLMFAAGLVGAWIIARIAGRRDEVLKGLVTLTNPYSFWPALKFAGLFVLVLLASRFAQAQYGASGVLVTSAVAGLVDVSAIALSVAGQVGDGGLSAETATLAILLAVVTNAAVKLGLAIVQGTRAFAFYLGCGLATMLAVGAVVAYATLL